MIQGCTLQELADFTGSALQGNASVRLVSVASIEKAGAGEISYIRDAKYRHYLDDSNACADFAAGYSARLCRRLSG
ncbi:MAG: hypothetical protein BWK73_54415 [Thiothrix lacustris]|uniref:UDP-3-O-[3-hydroxymyristoyl] glucosamine N-acyltransferase non-repeat region domain-containing protein n=1 Tax=Thiothrix lacustris TaxID=525917 RepID=A0A1Y1Q6K6_9GAMM|nr:MAG: hypothetical protein BWK73_54415 [Thiothrix lacustris]